MTTRLPPDVAGWLDGRAFVTLAMLDREAGPTAALMWVAREGDELLLTSRQDTQKVRNVARDGRVALVVHAPGDQYQSALLKGRAVVRDDVDRRVVDLLHRKYHGDGRFPYDPPGARRAVLAVTVETCHVFHG